MRERVGLLSEKQIGFKIDNTSLCLSFKKITEHLWNNTVAYVITGKQF